MDTETRESVMLLLGTIWVMVGGVLFLRWFDLGPATWWGWVVFLIVSLPIVAIRVSYLMDEFEKKP